MITIEKKKTHNNVGEKDFIEKYKENEVDLARNKIIECLNEYEKSINAYGQFLIELEDWEKDNYNNAKNMVKGKYLFNCGEYTYRIDIK